MNGSNKKIQNLNVRLGSSLKDCFGVIEQDVYINGRLYTYPLTSEFALRKVKSLLYRHKPAKALKILSLFTTEFNSFSKGAALHEDKRKRSN